MKSDFTENITIFAQSSIRIATDKVIYFDPYRIPEHDHDADAIFITHPHSDHFSPEDIRKVQKNNTVFVCPQQMQSKIESLRIPEEQICFVAPGQSYTHFSLSFQTIPAYNRWKLFHSKFKGWVGYIVTIDGVRCYVAGDTDATKESEQVNCDIALVPIGGFFTMNTAAAAKLVNQIKPQTAIPIHYGCRVGTKADAERFIQL